MSGNLMRIVISLVLVAVTTFLGYWLVLDERKHSQAIAYNERGNVLSELKRYDEAIEHYQQAITFDSGFAKAHNNLGSTLAQQGKFKEATAHFEKAINIDPNYVDARKNLELARSLTP